MLQNHQTKMADRNRRGNLGKKKKSQYRATQKTKIRRQKVSPHLFIMTLNVNGLNPPIKRHRVARWKEDSTICCLQEAHISTLKTNKGSKR